LGWASDGDDAGVTYNLLRSSSPNGPWTQVNADPLVPVGGQCGTTDLAGQGSLYYTIENIDADAEVSWFDAVSVNTSAAHRLVYLPILAR